jgi:hypothetical protein
MVRKTIITLLFISASFLSYGQTQDSLKAPKMWLDIGIGQGYFFDGKAALSAGLDINHSLSKRNQSSASQGCER